MELYENAKKFFNYIINKNYEIIRDPNSNDTMKIIYENNEVKCKYILLFSIEKSNKNKIIWSYSNPYIDQKTKAISLFIKNALDSLDKIETQDKKINKLDKINKFDWKNISENDLLKIFDLIIKHNLKIIWEDKIIDPIWIIVGDHKSFVQYYMITDIIYF